MSCCDHSELPSAPAADTMIWRYVPLAELFNTLNEKTLHFSRADRLPGSLIDIESQITMNALVGISAESTRRSLDLMKSVQSTVFTNSGYKDGSHAHFRWEIHGGNYEVAIRTTVDTLKIALHSSPRKIYMSPVQYIDFESASTRNLD